MAIAFAFSRTLLDPPYLVEQRTLDRRHRNTVYP